MEDERDWIANAYEGMSRRQFLARMTAAGATLSGFARSAQAVAGEIIRTPAEGLREIRGTAPSGGFAVPLYAACPQAGGPFPAVLVIPEIWGMHEYIQDVVRRFARGGSSPSPSSPTPGPGGCWGSKTASGCSRS